MRLMVVILSVLASMALAAAPAEATDPPAVGVSFPDTILLTESVGTTKRLCMDTLGNAADLQFTIDLSDLCGVATVDVSWEPGCTGTATTITCSGLEPPSTSFPLTIVPVAGAEPGRNGRLTVRAVALDRSPGSHTATVTIGEGVDLASILVPATSTTPGGRAAR